MATVVIMPKQGQSVESCILTELRKKRGDAIQPGDVLFAYETDKASFEEEAKAAGQVLEVFFNEGDEIPVLSNVMVIGQPGEPVDAFRPGAAPDASGTSDSPAPEASGTGDSPVLDRVARATRPCSDSHQSKPMGGSPMPPEPAARATRSGSPPIENPKSKIENSPASPAVPAFPASPVSPRARALAEKHGIAAAALAGSGPGGRVIEKDVLAAIESSPRITPLAQAMMRDGGGLQAPASGDGLAGAVRAANLVAGAPASAVATGSPSGDGDSVLKPLSNMRKLIAKAMHASLQNSAQLTHHLGADARRIMALRKQAKAAGANITINDFVCFAVIKALKKFPQVNAHFLGDKTRLFNKVHLGLAVDTERGLMVPALRNAGDMPIAQLAAGLKKLADACKGGSINPDLLSPEAASFTVSNLGNYGVEVFTPVINLPQAAILGVCTILPRPKDLGDGAYGFVPFLGLSLTYDHRALDGGEATRFLKQAAIEIETLEAAF